jgi:hypothetical protein
MPVLALVAGLCILVKPEVGSFIVALYLIIVGLAGIRAGAFSSVLIDH